MGKRVDVKYTMKPKLLIEAAKLRELLDVVLQVKPDAYIGLDEDTESLGIYTTPRSIPDTYLSDSVRMGRVLLEEERVAFAESAYRRPEEPKSLDPLELLAKRETTTHLNGDLLD